MKIQRCAKFNYQFLRPKFSMPWLARVSNKLMMTVTLVLTLS